MVFVELPIFIRSAASLLSDEDLASMQVALMENPAAGDLIKGGRGLRKLRAPLPGRGKSGGARIIYYHWVNEQQCYLLYAYAKNAAADLSKSQLKTLVDLMQEVIQDE
jgi:hypothetical protein